MKPLFTEAEGNKTLITENKTTQPAPTSSISLFIFRSPYNALTSLHIHVLTSMRASLLFTAESPAVRLGPIVRSD